MAPGPRHRPRGAHGPTKPVPNSPGIFPPTSLRRPGVGASPKVLSGPQGSIAGYAVWSVFIISIR